jgi:hypothetical protein
MDKKRAKSTPKAAKSPGPKGHRQGPESRSGGDDPVESVIKFIYNPITFSCEVIGEIKPPWLCPVPIGRQELQKIHAAAEDLLDQAEAWRSRPGLWGEAGREDWLSPAHPKNLMDSSLETLAALCRRAGLRWWPGPYQVIVVPNVMIPVSFSEDFQLACEYLESVFPTSLALRANLAFEDLGSVLRELGASEEPSQRLTSPHRLLQDASTAPGDGLEPPRPQGTTLVLWPLALCTRNQPPTEATVKRLRDVAVRLGKLANLFTEEDPTRSTDTLPARRRPLTPCQRDCIELIRDTGHRLTRREVLAALPDLWKEKNREEWTEPTVRIALHTLVKIKILNNKQKTNPKGYGLWEWGDGQGPASM